MPTRSEESIIPGALLITGLEGLNPQDYADLCYHLGELGLGFTELNTRETTQVIAEDDSKAEEVLHNRGLLSQADFRAFELSQGLGHTRPRHPMAATRAWNCLSQVIYMVDVDAFADYTPAPFSKSRVQFVGEDGRLRVVGVQCGNELRLDMGSLVPGLRALHDQFGYSWGDVMDYVPEGAGPVSINFCVQLINEYIKPDPPLLLWPVRRR